MNRLPKKPHPNARHLPHSIIRVALQSSHTHESNHNHTAHSHSQNTRNHHSGSRKPPSPGHTHTRKLLPPQPGKRCSPRHTVCVSFAPPPPSSGVDHPCRRTHSSPRERGGATVNPSFASRPRARGEFGGHTARARARRPKRNKTQPAAIGARPLSALSRKAPLVLLKKATARLVAF